MSLDIGAIITLVIFLLVELGTFLWWASGVSTTLNFMAKKLEKLDGFVSKTDHDRDIARIDKQFGEIWERLNKQHACPNAVNHNGAH